MTAHRPARIPWDWRGLVLAVGLMLATTAAWAQEPIPLRDDATGVCTHFDQGADTRRLLPLIDALGVGWIRDGTAWSQIEPTPRHYVIPARLQQWLEEVHARRLKVLLVLGYGNKAYHDPFDPDAYAAAAAFLAGRLRDRIDALEVLNEPNNYGFGAQYGGAWNGREPDGTISPYVKKYAVLLEKTVRAVKAVNPALAVVGYGAPAPATFHMIEQGPPAALDGISDHPYPAPGALPETTPYAATPANLQRDGLATADAQGTYRSQVRLFAAQAARYHLHAQLWNTEWGWSTTWVRDAKSNLSQETQAVYLVRRWLEQRALGVRGFYYELRDDGGDPAEAWQNFGLVDHRFNRKQGYFALQRCLRLGAPLVPAEVVPELEEGPGVTGPDGLRTRCYAFRATGSDHLWVAAWRVSAWPDPSPAGEATLRLAAGTHFAHATQLDLLSGATRLITLSAGTTGRVEYHFPLEGNPAIFEFTP